LSRKAYQIADQSGEQIQGVNGGISAAYQRSSAGWLIAAVFYFVAVGIRRIYETVQLMRRRTNHHWLAFPID
jgi:hypothetical protein